MRGGERERERERGSDKRKINVLSKAKKGPDTCQKLNPQKPHTNPGNAELVQGNFSCQFPKREISMNLITISEIYSLSAFCYVDKLTGYRVYELKMDFATFLYGESVREKPSWKRQHGQQQRKSNLRVQSASVTVNADRILKATVYEHTHTHTHTHTHRQRHTYKHAHAHSSNENGNKEIN
ncbi:hypothetical protein RUM43_002364 [Polyplax serrata]|uniref:Uncharacterized protein n=1 Tax=Polyplax serrata TaxID=468196 RepID=A0AAN8NYQ5_POLSC